MYGCAGRGDERLLLGRQQPDLAHLPARVQLVADPAVRGQVVGRDRRVRRRDDAGAGRQPHRLAVDGDVRQLAGTHRADVGTVLKAVGGTAGGEHSNDDEGKEAAHRSGDVWWRIRDSNPGHKDYDSSALAG